MADTDPPLFLFTTQEDWYGEIVIVDADAPTVPPEFTGRTFEMWVTLANQAATIVEASKILTMQANGGLEIKAGTTNTFIFRVTKLFANTLPRQDFTADILEVVDGERHLFMPVRVRYSEPSLIRTFLSRAFGVTYAANRQPIVASVGVPGRQGSAGNGIISAARPPVAGDGRDGDYFVDTSASPRLIYGPKTGGAWGAGLSLNTVVSAELQTARDQAVAAAQQTAQDRTATGDDRTAVHADAVQVAQDRASVTASRNQVATDAATSTAAVTTVTQARDATITARDATFGARDAAAGSANIAAAYAEGLKVAAFDFNVDTNPANTDDWNV